MREGGVQKARILEMVVQPFLHRPCKKQFSSICLLQLIFWDAVDGPIVFPAHLIMVFTSDKGRHGFCCHVKSAGEERCANQGFADVGNGFITKAMKRSFLFVLLIFATLLQTQIIRVPGRSRMSASVQINNLDFHYLPIKTFTAHICRDLKLQSSIE